MVVLAALAQPQHRRVVLAVALAVLVCQVGAVQAQAEPAARVRHPQFQARQSYMRAVAVVLAVPVAALVALVAAVRVQRV